MLHFLSQLPSFHHRHRWSHALQMNPTSWAIALVPEPLALALVALALVALALALALGLGLGIAIKGKPPPQLLSSPRLEVVASAV
jgi:ABC-type Na+ efflux pump permease subunit